jgi:hypothetical protein
VLVLVLVLAVVAVLLEQGPRPVPVFVVVEVPWAPSMQHPYRCSTVPVELLRCLRCCQFLFLR